MSDQGTHFLPRELAKLCYQHKWIDADKLFIAVSVCIAESNGYEGAVHVNDDGSRDRGLFQINDYAYPNLSDVDAFTATTNVAYARKIYESWGNSFKAWAAYTNSAYLGPRAAPYAAQGVANFLLVRHGLPIV